jgi:hypothetical protein
MLCKQRCECEEFLKGLFLSCFVFSSTTIVLTDNSPRDSGDFSYVTVAHQSGLTVGLFELIWARGFGSIRGVLHLDAPQ